MHIAGIRVSSLTADLHYQGRPDLALIEIAEGASLSVLTTRNQAAAPPVLLTRECLKKLGGKPTSEKSYWLVNSGNANAATGADGMKDARDTCEALGRLAGVSAPMVMPFSTGIIGVRLNAERLINTLPGLYERLDEHGWEGAALAIMTTDCKEKQAFRSAQIGGREIHLAGIAKGAAMLKPDMATMLSFAATDATCAPELLAQIHRRAVNRTFNRICVEGDTSTNDCATLAATAQDGSSKPLNAAEAAGLEEMLCDLCGELAEGMVRDAEGASHLIRIEVNGGRDGKECRQVADAIARCVLLKTCLATADPNWGRVLMALGYSGIQDLDLNTVSLYLGDVIAFERGSIAPSYSEKAGYEALNQYEQRIVLDLGRGEAKDYALTCDITQEYVSKNSDFRT